MTRLSALLRSLAAVLPVLAYAAASPTVYKAEDISAITLYDSTAVYLPERCPQTIQFTARARHLPELAKDKIGIFPHEIVVNGRPCTSKDLILDFAPIGPTDHYPPQWVFEDFRFHGFPVNFTCGDTSFSIRYGYFNDVSTKSTGGFLSSDVVYFDFAVIPNTRPFGFCSYAGRRDDGKRPLDFPPFPSQETWESFHELRKKTHPAPSSTNGTNASGQTDQSMEDDAEGGDVDEQDMGLDNGKTTGESSPQQTEAPGLERAASMADPFRS